ncbi:MAG: DMT family transporter [Planctomycetota bacterium]
MDSESRESVWRGRLLLIVAAVLWSTSGFFAKAPIFADWPVETRGTALAFWRAFFAAGVLIFFVRKVQWSRRLLPMITIFALMNWTYLSGMVYCEASLAIWLQYTSPAWVFLISWLLWHEKPKRKDWVLLAFASVGVTVILWAELSGASSKGVLYGLASGVFFAGVVVSLRQLRDLDAAWLIFLNHAVTALLFCPSVVTSETSWPSGSQWIYLALFGGLQMGLPYVLFAKGLKSISSHEASGISLLEPILVPLWVFIAWRTAEDYQYPAITTLVGAALILAGLIVSLERPKDSIRKTEANGDEPQL